MVGELQISNKTHRSIDRRLKFVATSLGHQQRTLMLRCFAISLKDGFFWWIIQNIDTVGCPSECAVHFLKVFFSCDSFDDEPTVDFICTACVCLLYSVCGVAMKLFSNKMRKFSSSVKKC